MVSKLRSALSVVGLVAALGILVGESASATSAIPDHSIGFVKLTPKLQRLVRHKRIVTVSQVGPQGPAGQPGTAGPEGHHSGGDPAKCEIVEAECLIYSQDFWRLQAALASYEFETGVYPEPPFCMKAVDEEVLDACPQELSYLYPDGSLGSSPWKLDLADPKGWTIL